MKYRLLPRQTRLRTRGKGVDAGVDPALAFCFVDSLGRWLTGDVSEIGCIRVYAIPIMDFVRIRLACLFRRLRVSSFSLGDVSKRFADVEYRTGWWS